MTVVGCPAAVPAGHEHKHSPHKIRSDAVAFGWDNSARPVMEIESGEIVELETTSSAPSYRTPSSPNDSRP
jgi:hypothetical protein